VFNLLANAVKFTPDHGRVDVVARHVGDEVHIAVCDTGVGIAPADQARIFDEFSQVGTHDMNTIEGTGLGLTLARRLVELHGGLLWVTSQPGVGSTFTFSLPLRHGA
jgi:signal transduction histidine kinase